MPIKYHNLIIFFDEGSITYIDCPDVPKDPLKFKDQKKYVDRLKETRSKTNKKDSIVIGSGNINSQQVVMAVHDFSFMGGSLGMAAGESIIIAIEEALNNKCPFILFKAIKEFNIPIFLDLKLHDIPITVYKTITTLLALEPAIINVHASGGKEMMLAASKALKDSGNKNTKIIAVTILTSLDDGKGE